MIDGQRRNHHGNQKIDYTTVNQLHFNLKSKLKEILETKMLQVKFFGMQQKQYLQRNNIFKQCTNDLLLYISPKPSDSVLAANSYYVLHLISKTALMNGPQNL